MPRGASILLALALLLAAPLAVAKPPQQDPAPAPQDDAGSGGDATCKAPVTIAPDVSYEGRLARGDGDTADCYRFSALPAGKVFVLAARADTRVELDVGPHTGEILSESRLREFVVGPFAASHSAVPVSFALDPAPYPPHGSNYTFSFRVLDAARLRVHDMRETPPPPGSREFLPGSARALAVNITNDGEAPTGPGHYILSVTTTVGGPVGIQPYRCDREGEWWRLPPLAPGETRTLVFKWDSAGNVGGYTYELGVYVRNVLDVDGEPAVACPNYHVRTLHVGPPVGANGFPRGHAGSFEYTISKECLINLYSSNICLPGAAVAVDAYAADPRPFVCVGFAPRYYVRSCDFTGAWSSGSTTCAVAAWRVRCVDRASLPAVP